MKTSKKSEQIQQALAAIKSGECKTILEASQKFDVHRAHLQRICAENRIKSQFQKQKANNTVHKIGVKSMTPESTWASHLGKYKAEKLTASQIAVMTKSQQKIAIAGTPWSDCWRIEP